MNTRLSKYENKSSLVGWLLHQLSTKTLAIISIHVLFLSIITSINVLDYSAKIALFAFLSAMTFWISTKIPAGFIAVALIAFIVLMNAQGSDLLYGSLSEEVVWLMVGSFIIGEAVKQSGLAERLSEMILRKSVEKNKILSSITAVLFASAFFIPSTSGRAALAMPIMKQLSEKFSPKEKSILAILAPVIILMSTSATLIGAGSHLIGIGLLETTAGESISYTKWLIWGVPFAIGVTLITCIIIKWMIWPKDGKEEIEMEETETSIYKAQQLNGKEKKTLALICILIAGWMTESIHGYDIAFITMLGAILVMLPNYGIVSWKQGMKSVSWNLIIFVAAATALGKVLVDTGVVKWIETEMFAVLNMFAGAPEWLIVTIILVITVTSHLYITSHTTRAVVFIPSLLLFSKTIGIDSQTVVFLSLIGMNYCVTFPVSSKALLLFYEEGTISYDARHLVKISIVLMPVYILTMLLFYFTYWKWTGMHLN
ncbi:SLC13 family permease [Metabacillus fastidiosus]|uniref:SLC13 family permease n=1 Tax=Metabacillus fastidiosus TaxID=1458 RepID=UPI000826EB26|nr:SLC13 family permease [Metabacillus fastidiosus]MED4452032.1 SLC13 family permease [Metabacillus fastidiosus]MED4462595.1 SLC13 family permease [Metabacillus fastidiosus]